MPLNFRHFKQILSTWTSYVVGHSPITDMNPGSITRTLGEAFSLELAQGYVQVQNLLNLFSIDKATGDDLDERGLDFNLARAQPTKATGVVTIGDQNLTSASTATSTLSVLINVAGTTLTIQAADYASFPASGSVIIDRGNALREKVPYTSKTAPNILNLSTGPVAAHQVGATVQRSTTGSDRSIAVGTAVDTAATVPIRFVTTAAAVLLDGDYQTPNIPISSVNPGASSNVTVGSITVFESPPFPTATVVNPGLLTGGADLETDQNYRARIKSSQQSLSSATSARIESEALKVQVVATGQRVVSAKCVEPVAPGLSTLYISDGTAGFAATQTNVSVTEVVINVAKLGQTRGSLGHWPVVNGTENFYVSLDRGTSTSVAASTLTDSTKTWTVNAYAGFLLKDVAGVFYTVVSNTATALTLSGTLTPSPGSYALFNPATTAFPTGSKLTLNTHFIINETNGQFQLTAAAFPTGLLANDSLIAYANGPTAGYIYNTGLLQLVQQTINGDPSNLTLFPGVKAAGTQVQVAVPTVVEPTIQGIIIASTGVDETTLRLPVQQAIVQYVNSLNISDNVLTSRIVQAAVGVPGVFDFQLQSPVLNIVVSYNQIAKIVLADVVVN